MEARREKRLGHPEPIVLKIPSSAEYVLLARLVISCVGRLAGFEPEDIYDLKLSVTEAATNVIRHAEVESFLIEYRVFPEAVEITVVDEGGGFDIEGFGDRPGEHGGFGLAVIQSLVDEVILDSTARGGTRLKMIRRRTPMGQVSQP
jgi:serine/threonine-protein kinase RsbW